MYLFIYNLCYCSLKFLLLLLSPILNKKTSDWINLRDDQSLFQYTPKTIQNKKIWIHASSGEIEYAKGLIRELKKSDKDIQIFVSYSSLSAPKLFKNIQNEVDCFFSLNWDTKKDNLKIINFLKPNLLIFSRTDFWPNLIYWADQSQIKLAAIAVYPKMNLFSRFILKNFCQKFNFVSCVDADHMPELQKILPQTYVTSIPDTRFDQVYYRLSQKTQIELPSNLKLITFGSTWPKDDKVLMKACPALFDKKYSIAWAPHDILHALDLKNQLCVLFPNKKIQLLNEYPGKQIDFDLLIINQIGFLADIYRFSKISFVGGSFVKKVHSVMEPLCANNFVIVGPHHQNSPEALKFKKKKFVKSVQNEDEFTEAVQDFELSENQKPQLKDFTEKHQGGSAKTLQMILNLLKN